MIFIFLMCALQVLEIFSSQPLLEAGTESKPNVRQNNPYSIECVRCVLGDEAGDAMAVQEEDHKDQIRKMRLACTQPLQVGRSAAQNAPSPLSLEEPKNDQGNVHASKSKPANRKSLQVGRNAAQSALSRLPSDEPKHDQGNVDVPTSKVADRKPLQAGRNAAQNAPSPLSSAKLTVGVIGERRQLFDKICWAISAQIRTRELSVAAAKQELLKAFDDIPVDQLNLYNGRGHTAAHVLTPVHWIVLQEIILKKSGLNLTAKSIKPDRFPGSTLAHNLAGMAWGKKDIVEDSIVTSLLLLHELDKGAHFGLTAGSSFTAGSGCTVWCLMDRANIKQRLEAELS